MENTCKCKACGKQFKPDARNRERQTYCPRRDCQRLRRTLRQRQHRQRAVARPMPSGAPVASRGPQTAARLSEADIRNENPAIIGLISMFTGLTSLAELQSVYRQLWLRGMEILSAGSEQAGQKPAIISLLQKTDGQRRTTG